MAKQISKGGIARTVNAKKIFDLFIRPIMRQFIVPPLTTENILHRKMEMWFDKDARDIWLARCRVPFAITGPRWVTSDTPEKLHISGEGNRQVAKGDYLWVRTDTRRPDVIDIEFADQVFATRTTDWQVLSEKVDYIL